MWHPLQVAILPACCARMRSQTDASARSPGTGAPAWRKAKSSFVKLCANSRSRARCAAAPEEFLSSSLMPPHLRLVLSWMSLTSSARGPSPEDELRF